MRSTERSATGLLAISLLVAGCGATPVPPSPSPSPASSLTSLPSASRPSAGPSTPAPSVAGTTGPVVIDATTAKSVALPWGPALDPRPLAVFGSRAYYVELVSGKDPATGKMVVPLVYRLHVADLATGSTADVLTLPPGHMIASTGSFGTSSFGRSVADADRLYWVEIWYDGLPNLDDSGGNAFDSLPQHWQVVALDLAGKSRSIVAEGTNHRVAVGMAGATINPPVIAVGGDRLAYTLEAATADAPNGNRIVLATIPDGTVVGTVVTKGFVPWVGLAGTVVAYREALGTNLDGATVQDARLMLRTLTEDAGAIGAVDEHVADAAISGDRLVWVRTDATDGSAWTTLLSDGVPVRIVGPTVAGFTQASGTGSDLVSASDAFAAWAPPGTVNGSDQSAVPFIWQAGDRAARLLILPAAVDAVAVSGGWLTWDESDSTPPRLWGVPLVQVAHTP
jgi:hypothetical protein